MRPGRTYIPRTSQSSLEQDKATATQTPSPFDQLNQQPVMAASRRTRVSGRGLYAPTPSGQIPRRRILGVDNAQQAQSDYINAHKNDDFFARNSPKKAPSTAAPTSVSSATVQKGGLDADPDAQPNVKVPPIRYGGNKFNPDSDADEPAKPAPKPGRTMTPASPGVDEVRTSGKGGSASTTPPASPFAALPKASSGNDPALALRIANSRAGQNLDATGLPKKKPVTDDSDDTA